MRLRHAPCADPRNHRLSPRRLGPNGTRTAAFLTLALAPFARAVAPDDLLADDLPSVRAWPPLPEAISSFGATTLDGAIYVFGGHVGTAHVHSVDNVRGDLRRLAPGAGTWETLASGEPLQGTALIAFERSLIRVGGLSPRNAAGAPEDLHSVASVQRFDVEDPGGAAWRDLPPLPEPRSSHDAVVLDGSLYVIGGWNIDGASKTFASRGFALDLRSPGAQWGELPAPPTTRRAVAVATLGNEIAAIGGLSPEGETLGTVELFDPKTSTWRSGPELPSDGFGASAIGDGDTLFASGRDGAIWRLTRNGESAAQWQQRGDWIAPRFFHRLVAVDGQLVALGGAGRGGHLRLVESTALDGSAAVELQSLSIPLPGRARNRQAILLRDGELLLFGGNRSTEQHDFAPEDFCTDTVRVDWRTATAEAIGSLPIARQSMAATFADEARQLGVLIGGFGNENDAPAARPQIQTWDVSGRELATLPLLLPEARTQMQVASFGDRVWIAGGLDYVKGREPAFEFPLAVLRFDPRAAATTFEPTGIEIQRPRRAFGAALVGSRWYFVGGMEREFKPVLECDVLDLATGAWSTLPPPPLPRISPELVALDGALYYFGGLEVLPDKSTRPATSIERFDLAAGAPGAPVAWTRVAESLPVPRAHLRAFAHRGRLLLVAPEETDELQLRLAFVSFKR